MGHGSAIMGVPDEVERGVMTGAVGGREKFVMFLKRRTGQRAAVYPSLT
jgi:hypothetical protein